MIKRATHCSDYDKEKKLLTMPHIQEQYKTPFRTPCPDNNLERMSKQVYEHKYSLSSETISVDV